MTTSPSTSGFQELPHTADWALRVWAPDLPSLFEQAAFGFYTLASARLSEGPPVKRAFHQEAPDAETLLVGFLSELLYLQEHEHLGFSEFSIHINSDRLSVEMKGAPLQSVDKPIKAVTYHNLHIRRTSHGCEAEIVFDV